MSFDSSYSSVALPSLPSNIVLKAFDGSIQTSDVFMMPSAQGNLRLLASDNIVVGSIEMSNVDPSTLSTYSNPIKTSIADYAGYAYGHATTPLHLGDTSPVEFVANNGSINIDKATIPKSISAYAGLDASIVGTIQQISPNDISVIEAGRDWMTGYNLTINGPGNVLFKVGRNFNENGGSITIAPNYQNKALDD